VAGSDQQQQQQHCSAAAPRPSEFTTADVFDMMVSDAAVVDLLVCMLMGCCISYAYVPQRQQQQQQRETACFGLIRHLDAAHLQQAT
jgi:hypothetical protein